MTSWWTMRGDNAMYRSKTKVIKLCTGTQHEVLSAVGLTRREKSKSLGDLVNLRRELEDKLDGKVRRTSAHSDHGRCGIRPTTTNAKSKIARPNKQQRVFHEAIQNCWTSKAHAQESLAPPPSPNYSAFYKKIVSEQATDQPREGLSDVRLGDILRSASLIDSNRFKRVSKLNSCRPVCANLQVNCGQNSESAHDQRHGRPTRRIVVRMPNVYGAHVNQCYFSYRHKKWRVRRNEPRAIMGGQKGALLAIVQNVPTRRHATREVWTTTSRHLFIEEPYWFAKRNIPEEVK